MTLEITSKQRAYLRSLCNSLQPVLYIGKEGITDGTVQEAWDILEARELFKCSVQREAPLTAREACQILCERVHAAPVQCIGGKFSIYRPRRKDPTIILP